MKKWIVLAIVVLAGIALLVPVAFAQGPNADTGYANFPMMSGPHGQGAGLGHGPGFMDEDGDGVCDNFVDEDGDGVCDLAGTGQGGHGPGFTDEDGDGVCDHAGTGGGHYGQGHGRGMMGARWQQ